MANPGNQILSQFEHLKTAQSELPSINIPSMDNDIRNKLSAYGLPDDETPVYSHINRNAHNLDTNIGTSASPQKNSGPSWDQLEKQILANLALHQADTSDIEMYLKQYKGTEGYLAGLIELHGKICSRTKTTGLLEKLSDRMEGSCLIMEDGAKETTMKLDQVLSKLDQMVRGNTTMVTKVEPASLSASDHQEIAKGLVKILDIFCFYNGQTYVKYAKRTWTHLIAEPQRAIRFLKGIANVPAEMVYVKAVMKNCMEGIEFP